MDRVPVHLAAERGHTTIVDLLVDKCKASIAARTKDGSTLMHIASTYGHPDTALTFLRKGVPLQMPNKVYLGFIFCNLGFIFCSLGFIFCFWYCSGI
jgi:ankyrin repeat protein